MILWNKIKEFVEKTYTDKDTGNIFLSTILIFGAFGFILCLIWFGMMCAKGIPLWTLIFDIAIILFCAWAIIWGIIPMAKDAFKSINENDRKEEIHRSAD